MHIRVSRRLRVALPGTRGEYDLYEVAEVRDDRVTPAAQNSAPKSAGAHSALAAANLS